MASLTTVNTQGAVTGTVEANDAVFNVEPNTGLIHDVVVAFQANQRQGTHKTKVRSEVSGGGVKPFRQKGTGRARQGSIREPQMKGGGTVHGPVPRDYRQYVTPVVRRKALCMALTDRVRDQKLSVLQGLSIAAPKTKDFDQMLGKVASEGRKTLIITPEIDQNVILSSRNIPRVTIRTAADVNAVDVLDAVRVIVQAEALPKLEERLS